MRVIVAAATPSCKLEALPEGMTTLPVCDILVVEDDREIQYVLAEILSDEGYTVHTADHGLEALDYLETAPTLPRLILADLMMPVMDGWALCRKLQRHPLFASIPVVILSAVANSSPELALLGVAAALSKPVNIELLLTTITRVSGSPA